MTATLIRRVVPPPNFDSAINMLLMDEIEADGVQTPPPSGTVLAVYGKQPAAPTGYGAPAKGSPSPNQGKNKRKRTTNNGNYDTGSSSSGGAQVQQHRSRRTRLATH
jgi:hypothetical protein